MYRRLFHFVAVPLFCVLATFCGADKEEQESFASLVESAHHKESFIAKDVVVFDLILTFGGNERLNGQISLSTDSRMGKIVENNGDQLYYEDDRVFYKDRDSLDVEKVRFKAYTWSYFFLMPFKLTDPGTVWEDYSPKTLNDDTYKAEKLMFKSEVGDSPDDWYIVYADTNDYRMYAAAYIVTYSKSKEDAEVDPHAIVYENYTKIDGIPFAQKWTFWEWRDGVLTKQLGEAQLSNFQFKSASEVSFTAPDHFKEI